MGNINPDTPGQPTFRPQNPIRTRDLRRMWEQAAAANRSSSTGDVTDLGGGTGSQSTTDATPAHFWARITAPPICANNSPVNDLYSFVEVQDDGTGDGWRVTTDSAFGQYLAKPLSSNPNIPVAGPPLSLTTNSPGESYYYVVTATWMNMATGQTLQSAFSNEVGSSGGTLSWSAPTPANGYTLLGYAIWRSLYLPGNENVLAGTITDPTVTSFSDSGGGIQQYPIPGGNSGPVVLMSPRAAYDYFKFVDPTPTIPPIDCFVPIWDNIGVQIYNPTVIPDPNPINVNAWPGYMASVSVQLNKSYPRNRAYCVQPLVYGFTEPPQLPPTLWTVYRVELIGYVVTSIRYVTDAAFVQGQSQITSSQANWNNTDLGPSNIPFGNSDIGNTLYAPGYIPYGTTIASVQDSSNATMSQPATTDGTNIKVYILGVWPLFLLDYQQPMAWLQGGYYFGYSDQAGAGNNPTYGLVINSPNITNDSLEYGNTNPTTINSNVINLGLIQDTVYPPEWSNSTESFTQINVQYGGNYAGATGTDGLGNIFVTGLCINVGGAVSAPAVIDGGNYW